MIGELRDNIYHFEKHETRIKLYTHEIYTWTPYLNTKILNAWRIVKPIHGILMDLRKKYRNKIFLMEGGWGEGQKKKRGWRLEVFRSERSSGAVRCEDLKNQMIYDRRSYLLFH